tara:strand:- start:184 stop:381 length:198 start_codon:yes stop_codon:yes gene_type:complete
MDLSKLKPEFKIGQFVYSVTDPDQYRLIVTALRITSTAIQYECSFKDECSTYLSFELSSEKTFQM